MVVMISLEIFANLYSDVVKAVLENVKVVVKASIHFSKPASHLSNFQMWVKNLDFVQIVVILSEELSDNVAIFV